jgi:outer membrane protein OmpA-like peptidoglycan-associated protein
MPSAIALRALLGAGLGLGALDVVWINVALAPQLIAADSPPPVVRAQVVEETPAPPVDPVAPPPAPVEEPRAPLVASVYFETGSSELSAASRKALAELVAKAPESGEIVAEGHADARGTERLNEALSKNRAVAVQEALVQLGVAQARIQVKFAGAANSSSELWRDRRVDIQIAGGTR